MMNYDESREAVEKLKAYTRLKENNLVIRKQSHIGEFNKVSKFEKGDKDE